MKKLIGVAIVGVLLAGCGSPYEGTPGHVSTVANDDVYAVLDHKRSVTCYVYNGVKKGGIHCFTADQLPFQEN